MPGTIPSVLFAKSLNFWFIKIFISFINRAEHLDYLCIRNKRDWFKSVVALFDLILDVDNTGPSLYCVQNVY